MKKKTQEEFLQELTAELIRTEDLENYDLSKVQYINATTKVIVVCKIHGEKLVNPFHLLNGRRCNSCKANTLSMANRTNIDIVIKKASEVHVDKYDYSKYVYSNNATKSIITCPLHGDFVLSMDHHINRGRGCPTCKKISKRTIIETDLRDTFLTKAKLIHKDKYDYSKVIYTTCKDPIVVTCKTDGDFLVTPDNHINALSGCPTCSNKVSLAEIEVRTFIQDLGLEVICNQPLLDKKHIDIFIPSLNIGIEYCGLYWHSDKFRGTVYHRDKYLAALSKGIKLIQIFENEWLSNKEIVKNILLNKLHRVSHHTYARKLQCKIIPNNLAIDFYNKYHLQSGNTAISLSLGLFKNNELLACMSFSSANMTNNITELVRFASNGRVSGGFSKLLKNSILILKDKGLTKIVSYSDNRWSQGEVYEANGFIYADRSQPRYWWAKGITLEHRRGFQRKYLSSKLAIFDESLSEAENCIANGYFKIHDAGVTRWEKEI